VGVVGPSRGVLCCRRRTLHLSVAEVVVQLTFAKNPSSVASGRHAHEPLPHDVAAAAEVGGGAATRRRRRSVFTVDAAAPHGTRCCDGSIVLVR
jgi:hypothetical protein